MLVFVLLAYDVADVPIYHSGAENELMPPHHPAAGQEHPLHTLPKTTPTPTVTSTMSPITTITTMKQPPIITASPDVGLEDRYPKSEQNVTTYGTDGDVGAPVDVGEGSEGLHPSYSGHRPVMRPEPNKPDDHRCKLPINPNYDVDYIEAGYRFFSMREQRIEIPTLHAKLRKHHDVSLVFRTDYPEGLLFYASDKKHSDFIALYLYDGRIHHSLRLGNIYANISSTEELNDGQWHTVQFIRVNRRISLIIDLVEQEPVTELEDKTPRPMIIEFPIYIGGIPRYLEDDVRQNLEHSLGNTSYYNGCLKDLKFNGMSLDREPTLHHVVPCSEQTEPGYFFNRPTGFVKLFDRFTVGTDFSLSFDFRPRDPDGLLFSVHGKNTYMILELIDNQLWFTVKSDSKNIVMTNYTLPDDGSYCDGNWRNVHAVKSKFVITISVDYISAKPGVGTEGSTTTKTNRPLFLGGHQAFNKAPGLKTRKTYKGCIRNIHVNKKPVRITPNLIYGEIWQGSCPLG